MSSITFGGDPETFMEAPRMENKGLEEIFGAGGNPISMILDLIGVHRQVAKGPKEPDQPAQAAPNPTPQASVPQVLTDITQALSGGATPPAFENRSPITTFGQKWMDSIKPLTLIDPNTGR